VAGSLLILSTAEAAAAVVAHTVGKSAQIHQDGALAGAERRQGSPHAEHLAAVKTATYRVAVGVKTAGIRR
jgi:hypothetical protein